MFVRRLVLRSFDTFYHDCFTIVGRLTYGESIPFPYCNTYKKLLMSLLPGTVTVKHKQASNW